MKKFLYIAYYFPPFPSIASMRSWKLAKYIRELGWEPVVLASESDVGEWGYSLPDVDVHRIENKLFMEGPSRKTKARLTGIYHPASGTTRTKNMPDFIYRAARSSKWALREIFAFPDDYNDWRKKALEYARNLVSQVKIDLILSTSGPFSSHIVASTLSKETGIPWVADYRDLWSLNHNSIHTSIRRAIERKYEVTVVESASAIITVSDPLSFVQKELLQMETMTITNGFDPEDYQEEVDSDPIFSVIYTGNVYEGKQNPSLLFEAIDRLLTNGQIERDKLEIHFYGPERRPLVNLLKGKGIDDMVHIHDGIPFTECVRRQKAATVLLFLNWNDPREKGLFSGKLFEYLGARRPILAISRNQGSVVDKLIETTRAGVVLDDPAEIACTLKKWYDQFYRIGSLPYEGVETEIMKYNRKNQAKQFAELFDTLSPPV